MKIIKWNRSYLDAGLELNGYNDLFDRFDRCFIYYPYERNR